MEKREWIIPDSKLKRIDYVLVYQRIDDANKKVLIPNLEISTRNLTDNSDYSLLQLV